MSATEPEYRFNQILMEIAVDLTKTIGEAGGIKWRRAYLDARFAEGGASLTKFRLELDDGQVLKGMRESFDVLQLLEDLWSLRHEGLVQHWFGVKIILLPGGECETQFNYDPECINDRAFFDT